MKFVVWVCVTALAAVSACQGETSAPGFETERVIEHVEAQCRFGPRLPNSPARDSVVAYIEREMKRRGASVTLQRFEMDDPYGDRTLNLVNVVASFEPGRRKRVMLAAHFDSRPRADQETEDSLRVLPVPGAVDGAAGVGILLEMGRLLGERMPGRFGVDLVFFDGEDYGKQGENEFYLLGSKHFAANLDGYHPECAIVIDMVGGAETVIAREAYSQTNSAELTDELFGRARDLGLTSFIELRGPPVYDDHVPLIQAGLNAVDIFGYEYRAWHTTRDTPDQVDPVRVDEIGSLLSSFLYDYPF